jgi:integrase
MAIGYRRGAKGGTWIAKLYTTEHGRRFRSLGTADDVTDADGVHVLSFGQAQEAARKWFADQARADGGLGHSGPYTVKDCVEEYLIWLEGHGKPGSSPRYKANAHILPKLGAFDCSKLTMAIIQKWHRDLAASPARLRTKKGTTQKFRKGDSADNETIRRRRASANRTLTILRAALNRAWREEGKIASDNAWRRVLPFRDVDAPRTQYLKLDQALRLANACDPDFRRLVQAALVTGARYGELIALKAGDFNPDSGTVLVRTSKSGRGRHIVLNEEGVTLFRSLAAGKADDAILLPRTDGLSWKVVHQIRRMAKACRIAKIRPAVGFHALRHTWASHAVMAGVPLMVIARNLGHSDTRMVEKHYGHLAPSYIADAIRAGAPTFGIKPERKVVSINAKA